MMPNTKKIVTGAMIADSAVALRLQGKIEKTPVEEQVCVNPEPVDVLMQKSTATSTEIVHLAVSLKLIQDEEEAKKKYLANELRTYTSGELLKKLQTRVKIETRKKEIEEYNEKYLNESDKALVDKDIDQMELDNLVGPLGFSTITVNIELGYHLERLAQVLNAVKKKVIMETRKKEIEKYKKKYLNEIDQKHVDEDIYTMNRFKVVDHLEKLGEVLATVKKNAEAEAAENEKKKAEQAKVKAEEDLNKAKNAEAKAATN